MYEILRVQCGCAFEDVLDMVDWKAKPYASTCVLITSLDSLAMFRFTIQNNALFLRSFVCVDVPAFSFTRGLGSVLYGEYKHLSRLHARSASSSAGPWL